MFNYILSLIYLVFAVVVAVVVLWKGIDPMGLTIAFGCCILSVLYRIEAKLDEKQ